MIGTGKTKPVRRYAHWPEQYECVLCGRVHAAVSEAEACFDQHDDTLRELTSVLHHQFCKGKHCATNYCACPTHCHYHRYFFPDEPQGKVADAQRRHWRKVALRVRRFAREHGIPALTFVKFLHNLHT